MAPTRSELSREGDREARIAPAFGPFGGAPGVPTSVVSCRAVMRRDDEQITRDRAQSDPSLDAVGPVIEAPRDAMSSFQHTDASFAADPPAQPPAKPALTFVCTASRGLLAGSRQDHAPHAAVLGRAFVGRRSEPAIGDGQVRGVAEDLGVRVERRDPQRHIGGCHGSPTA